MNILIFGATGATGLELVSQGLKQRHLITAFVRDPSKLTVSDSLLKVKQGDVADFNAVAAAAEGQHAVLSALGASTPFKHDQKLITGIRNIVWAMENLNVKRLIYLSYLGVEESRREMGFFMNHILAPIMKPLIEDHEAKEEAIQNSRLDWTIVRPPKLTNGKHTGKFRAGERIQLKWPAFTISRADVAHFMLQELTDKRFIKRAPLIMH